MGHHEPVAIRFICARCGSPLTRPHGSHLRRPSDPRLHVQVSGVQRPSPGLTGGQDISIGSMGTVVRTSSPAWWQLRLQFILFAVVHARPSLSIAAAQGTHGTPANCHERDHDGLAVWAERSPALTQPLAWGLPAHLLVRQPAVAFQPTGPASRVFTSAWYSHHTRPRASMTSAGPVTAPWPSPAARRSPVWSCSWARSPAIAPPGAGTAVRWWPCTSGARR